MFIMEEARVKINWKNCERDELVAEYFCEKVMKIMDFRFVNKSEAVKGVISFLPKKNIYHTTLTVAVNHCDPVHAESEENENVYHAINQTIDKVVDQLRRIKTKLVKN